LPAAKSVKDADADRELWAVKPWWCQPWSIVLTGCVLPAASWLLLGRWWITAPLLTGVLMWWWLFLVVVPRAYREQGGGSAPPPSPD
jgi:hypothetical protein